jgi:hypothetical protein
MLINGTDPETSKEDTYTAVRISMDRVVQLDVVSGLMQAHWGSDYKQASYQLCLDFEKMQVVVSMTLTIKQVNNRSPSTAFLPPEVHDEGRAKLWELQLKAGYTNEQNDEK